WVDTAERQKGISWGHPTTGFPRAPHDWQRPDHHSLEARYGRTHEGGRLSRRALRRSRSRGCCGGPWPWACEMHWQDFGRTPIRRGQNHDAHRTPAHPPLMQECRAMQGDPVQPAPSMGLQSFNFGAAPIRVVMKDGEPWWVAADVCNVLD